MGQPREVYIHRLQKCSRSLSAGFLIALLIFLGVLHVQIARADIAPPAQPPGVNPVPGDEATQVRMLSEDVLIEVQSSTPTGSLGQARVTAQFTMQNLGDTEEKLAVRFPLTFMGGGDNGYGSYPEIKEFSAWVNDRQVLVRRVSVPGPGDPETSVPWAEFDVKFPVGVSVPVEVSYLTEGVGEYPFISFKYILETGAGWRDTIGEADLTMRLPYEASNQNVIFDDPIGWSETTPGSNLAGREVQWKFNNLEPTSADDLEVSLVMPSAWKSVLLERENTVSDPEDGEAWGRLGKLYKEIISYRRGLRQDAGGLKLYQLAVEAYEKATQLLPRDALWHAGFGDLLIRNYYWNQFFSQYPDQSIALHALDEFRIALELDPHNPKIQELIDEFTYSMPEAIRKEGDEYTFRWLTATPTSRPTVTVTATNNPDIVLITAIPTQSPSPQPTPTEVIPPTSLPSLTPTALEVNPVVDTQLPAATPTPESKGLQICGVNIGMIVGLFLVGTLWWGKRWKK
jgi:hypothetical protein